MLKNIALVALVTLFVACEKPEGEGGNSSIKGKVMKEIRHTITNPENVVATVPAADEDVFIIYGDETSIGDDVATNYDGEYEFKYLRPGKYTIYIYSGDTTEYGSNPPIYEDNRMPIIQEVEINDRKETVEVPTMTTYEDF